MPVERALVMDGPGLFRDVASPVPEPVHSSASGRKRKRRKGQGRPVGSGYKQAIKNAKRSNSHSESARYGCLLSIKSPT